MSEFPEFENDEEAVRWFDTHDTSAYIEESSAVDRPFAVFRTPHSPSELQNGNTDDTDRAD